ncbi:uncharacterized protein Ecym_4373 [Eremothecium cymbalariae DBVPG|uniref:Uncharacterized protein n=1 Tax=Eremothecium cymbalariae (strain CBS 270.75 / DBVPG 7215 / KCTC 17166 / NRRL Y-17582) TaxID=931890 RepID=G8JTS6_ERECY|nr:hypothetical protein Ecym_4373 [Eremothecium cymbalariae DBVPG\
MVESNAFEEEVLQYMQVGLRYLVLFTSQGISISMAFCKEHPILAKWMLITLILFIVYRFICYIFVLIKRFSLLVLLLLSVVVYQRGPALVWNEDIPMICSILATNRSPKTAWSNLLVYADQHSSHLKLLMYQLVSGGNVQSIEETLQRFWNGGVAAAAS